MSLSGTVAVVLGTSGNVGWGAARALLDAGATVVGPSRDAARAAAVADSLGHPGFHAVVGDISDPRDAMRLRDLIVARHGQVDHVVASVGSWWQQGRIIDQTPDEYRRVQAMLLDGQVYAAQAFLPGMVHRPGTSYTIVTGVGGHASIPGTGLLVVAVGGVYGLSRMLRAEHSRDAVRVNELMIGARIERAPREGVIPSAVFGAAVRDVALSTVRGEVLRYEGPTSFQVPGS